MTKYIQFFILFSFLSLSAQAQKPHVMGMVLGFDGERDVPLIGANVSWLGTIQGTTVGLDGKFHLDFPETLPAKLLISFVGFESDTILIEKREMKHLHVKLEAGKTLNVVEIRERLEASRLSFSSDFHLENLSKKELQKAACCNLSESFETNASIDVSASDAVSGAKRITMLGLDGIYSQIQFEGIPWIRGLGANTGLSFIPGTWVEGIQVSKGAGSVTMGYESITGQINIETFKPDGKEEPILINLYGSAMGRLESNIRLKKELSEKWSSMLLIHADAVERKNDFNSDGFLDMPLRRDIHVFNRWKYKSERWRAQFGVAGLLESQTGGQLNFDRNDDRFLSNNYGFGTDLQMVDVFFKSGYLYPLQPYKSVAVLSKFRVRDQESFYGRNNYTGMEEYLFAKLIYQDIIRTTVNTYRIGASFVWNRVDETFQNQNFFRNELVPGVYAEYAYKPNEQFSWVSGVRADLHNLFGLQVSPRTHLKYNPSEKTAIRLSAGRGFRAPNQFMDNSGFLVSSRIVYPNASLQAESGWNMGTVFSQKFDLFKRESTLSLDYYHTEFENQLVVDIETPGELHFYNLDGRSFSDAVQLEYNFEPVERLRLKVAAKYYEVRVTYRGNAQSMPPVSVQNLSVQRSRPLIPKYRGLFNAEYEIKKDMWFADFTTNFIGASRLPSTQSFSALNRRSNISKDYALLNAQLRRNGKHVEVYAGAENILNYKQPRAIISADNPFSSEFDASMIWAPVNGRVLYLGMNFKF
jgi:outer membrane receptor for ferrienterochelin and colicins